MAQQDPSPVVRLYLSSAVQRLPFSDRWEILGELAKHDEDSDDHNLPRMYWFGLEPMVPKYPERSLRLAIEGKIPVLQEFVARRMVSGDIADGSQPEWQEKHRARRTGIYRPAMLAKAVLFFIRYFAISRPSRRTRWIEKHRVV